MAKTSIKAKAYYNTASFGTPTWVELTLIGDLQIAGQWAFAEAPTRETPVVRGARTTLPLSVSGRMRVVDDNTAYIAFDDAHMDSDTTLDVMVLNGDDAVNGVTGVRFVAELVNWSEDQAIGNVLYKDFELRPSLDATNLPKRVEVTSNAPVFTNFD